MYKIMKKNYIKSDFKETFLELVSNDRSDKRFLWTSKFCPLACLPLTCGYIHLLDHEKMCMKSEVEEILFNPSHAAIKISINATAAEFICKNIFPYLCR